MDAAMSGNACSVMLSAFHGGNDMKRCTSSSTGRTMSRVLAMPTHRSHNGTNLPDPENRTADAHPLPVCDDPHLPGCAHLWRDVRGSSLCRTQQGRDDGADSCGETESGSLKQPQDLFEIGEEERPAALRSRTAGRCCPVIGHGHARSLVNQVHLTTHCSSSE